ncbi:MAG: hypothetical protein R3B99_02900 [Polyangiales bacterium]
MARALKALRRAEKSSDALGAPFFLLEDGEVSFGQTAPNRVELWIEAGDRGLVLFARFFEPTLLESHRAEVGSQARDLRVEPELPREVERFDVGVAGVVEATASVRDQARGAPRTRACERSGGRLRDGFFDVRGGARDVATRELGVGERGGTRGAGLVVGGELVGPSQRVDGVVDAPRRLERATSQRVNRAGFVGLRLRRALEAVEQLRRSDAADARGGDAQQERGARGFLGVRVGVLELAPARDQTRFGRGIASGLRGAFFVGAGHEMGAVAVARVLVLAALFRALGRELAHACVETEAASVAGDERAITQLLQRAEGSGADDGLRGAKVEGASKDGAARERAAFGLAETGPRGDERVAKARAPFPARQVEVGREAGEQLVGPERVKAGGGQLDGERHSVERGGDLLEHAAFVHAGPARPARKASKRGRAQRAGGLGGERADSIKVSLRDAETLTRRDHGAGGARGGEQVGEQGTDGGPERVRFVDEEHDLGPRLQRPAQLVEPRRSRVRLLGGELDPAGANVEREARRAAVRRRLEPARGRSKPDPADAGPAPWRGESCRCRAVRGGRAGAPLRRRATRGARARARGPPGVRAQGRERKTSVGGVCRGFSDFRERDPGVAAGPRSAAGRRSRDASRAGKRVSAATSFQAATTAVRSAFFSCLAGC